MKPAALALIGALASPLAVAHNLWIEPIESGNLQAMYGEPEIRVTERSPGKLDSLVLMRTLRGDASERQPSDWRQQSTGFALNVVRDDGAAMVEARSTHINHDIAKGGTHARYYARRASWPLTPTTPAMALDIVPTAQPNTFAVHFKGVPLKHGTLKVIAPSLWLQVHDIDEHGLVRIQTPWRGLYVLDVDTREQRSGEIGGEKFASVVHRATLSFTMSDGPVFERAQPAQYRAH